MWLFFLLDSALTWSLYTSSGHICFTLLRERHQLESSAKALSLTCSSNIFYLLFSISALGLWLPLLHTYICVHTYLYQCTHTPHTCAHITQIYTHFTCTYHVCTYVYTYTHTGTKMHTMLCTALPGSCGLFPGEHGEMFPPFPHGFKGGSFF